MGRGVLRVRILGKHEQLADIIGPVAQGVEPKRALDRRVRARGLDPGERIAVSHTPPAVHHDIL